MRFQVPQFIDIEDKVIGPLTIKMFAYYAVAGIILVPLFLIVDISLFITLALPVIAVAAAFAHVKLYGQKLITLLINAVKYYAGGVLFIWRRVPDQKMILIQGAEYNDFTNFDYLPSSSLSDIAQSLQTQGNVSIQDEADPMSDEEGSQEREDKT